MTQKPTPERPPIIGMVEWFRPGEYDRVRRALQDLNALGIHHLRTGISWADWHVEGTWEWYDWLLPLLGKQVEILPCFLYTPPSQGLTPKTSSPPRDPKAYADFIDVMITRYGEYFEWIELWNEPNNRMEYDFTQDYSWSLFSQMVIKAGFWARKRGKKTLLGGMSPIDPNWLQKMADQGVLELMDAVGIHGFPYVFDQQWNGWAAKVAAVRQVMKKNHSQAQLWITEAGFSTWQGDEVTHWQEFRKAIQAQVDRVYWYSLYDLDPEHATIGGFHLDEREYHFGLKHTNGREKLLYKLLKDGGTANIHHHDYIKRGFPAYLKETYSLITGGAGFIGTNLAKALLQANKRVMIFDSLARPGVQNNLKWLYDNFNGRLRIQVADIRDKRAVEESVRHADEVFNFSAQVAVTTSLEDPRHDFEVNIGGALNLLEAIRRSGRKIPLAFTSTNKVYGGLNDLEFQTNGYRYYPLDSHLKQYGIDETRPLDFHSPYGCSKGAADQYVLDYSRSFDLQTIVFRMSCIYGPHQMGTEDQGWVAHFIIRMLENKPITIYGDGKQVRDILFVEDLVNAFTLAMQNISLLSGQAFNIGGGPQNTVSLLEIINLMKQVLNQQIKIQFKEWRTGDQLYYVSDVRKFQQATGWQPEVSTNHGVKKLVSWLSAARGIALSESLRI